MIRDLLDRILQPWLLMLPSMLLQYNGYEYATFATIILLALPLCFFCHCTTPSCAALMLLPSDTHLFRPSDPYGCQSLLSRSMNKAFRLKGMRHYAPSTDAQITSGSINVGQLNVSRKFKRKPELQQPSYTTGSSS